MCPEDATQMSTGKELLIDPLPGDVKPRVVWRENFWLTDEALSVYVRSAGLLSSEMHSPIMALGNGVPAIVCRFAEQSSKGFMWRDIGLGDWLFDLQGGRTPAGGACGARTRPKPGRRKAACRPGARVCQEAPASNHCHRRKGSRRRPVVPLRFRR